jgi:hypothetical protein
MHLLNQIKIRSDDQERNYKKYPSGEPTAGKVFCLLVCLLHTHAHIYVHIIMIGVWIARSV